MKYKVFSAEEGNSAKPEDIVERIFWRHLVGDTLLSEDGMKIDRAEGAHKYVLIAGDIRVDGEYHYVSEENLVLLYGVDRSECCLPPSGILSLGWVPPEGVICLFPREDGDYSLPTK